MIIGIGVDIIEIHRIKKALENNTSFLHKVFTKEEIAYFEKKNNRIETLAGNFAAKEAISKALGTGFRGFTLRDVEVVRDDLGKPLARLYNGAKHKGEAFGEYKIHLSISHDKERAIAYCVLEVL